jgi:electron transport complex protein RnfC
MDAGGVMAPRPDFPSGLVLDTHKEQASLAPIFDVPPPALLRFALDQGSGDGLEPVVTVGATVAVGSVIARPTGEFAVPLHSSVSGRIVAIESHESGSDGGACLCIDVENDGLDTRDASLRQPADFAALDPATLVERLREAGIAGLGGAGFPTATKLAVARSRGARRLVLNGAECEPWICCDDALMRVRADEVLLGARVLMRAIEAETCVVAIEDDKPAAVEAMQAAAQANAIDGVSIQVVPAVYPQGAERQLITAVAGVEVPSGGLPADAGYVCQNVATAGAVARWARTGEPLMSRVVTVTGGGVAEPRNVHARLGTPLATLVAAAGGYRGEPLRLIAGGSMTGRSLASDDVGLTKAINCVFVATREDLVPRLHAVEVACIRCGDCARVCPAGLLPQQIHRAVLAQDAAAAVQFGVWDCIDCGCCDYVCPSQIPLALRFREERLRLREREFAAERATAARERHERHERRQQQAALAQQREFDAARDEARRASGTPDPGASR